MPRRSLVLLTLLLAAACDGAPRRTAGPPECLVGAGGIMPAVVPLAGPHDSLFTAASREFDLPAGLLRAVGYVETRWQMVEGGEEFEGVAPAFGVMALRGDRLVEGARLAAVDEALVKRRPAENIRAAAALLHAWAEAAGIRADDPGAWAPLVARYSGIAAAAGQASYAADVFSVLDGRRAASADMAAGPLASCAPPPPPPPVPTDQAGATWRTSPNFNSRMDGPGGVVHMVIIHSCEGSYAGCWSWLANTQSQVSAHYVVREDGAEITQLVREASRAWHIGASYDSTLNANHDGRLHGVQSNHFTIGVEHAGYASQASWPAAQIDASARLVCDVARRWEIPRDRLHIVAHGQLQPWNRTDPGPNWPWADYLARIAAYCA